MYFSFLHTCLQGNVSLINYTRQFVYIPQKMPKEFELSNLIVDKRILPYNFTNQFRLTKNIYNI